jgi:hypothetical protein
MKTAFGVHLILETTLNALDESALPEDLDAMLPAKIAAIAAFIPSARPTSRPWSLPVAPGL